jgi:UDP-N-acetylmuramate: L-alanyl-gamma-D-glutamyl-meso-diaminopimelate ligase
MGVCGVGMASLAGLLRQKGFEVTGSDEAVYPPMSDFVARLGIEVRCGYGAANLQPPPDLVVIGNVIRRENPEAQAVLELGLPYLSLPEALGHFFLEGKTSIVIAGTHGKTTASGLTAWLLESAGLSPGFMVGGIVRGFEAGFRLGAGENFVVEGDEYDTAFFDKGPKFLHYRPKLVAITGIEFDHADVYADLEAVKRSFARLIEIIPEDGLLLAQAEDANLAGLLPGARCRVETYGLAGGALWRAGDASFGPGGTAFELFREGKTSLGRFTAPLHGRHNLQNCLAALALALSAGAGVEGLRRGLATFGGVARRQEVKGEIEGVTLIEDFAHHPSAVRETLSALGVAYPGRRLICAFEPRTNSSRRKIFQADYARSFGAAEVCLIRQAPGLEKIPEAERFSSERLVADLRARRQEAHFFPDTKAIIDYLLDQARAGDVIVTMSNGGFDNIQERLAAGLKAREGLALAAGAGEA